MSKWGHNFENCYRFIINFYSIMNIIPASYLISIWNPTGCIKLLRQNILHRRFEIRMNQTVPWEQKEIYSYRFRACCHCLCNNSHWLHEVNTVQLTLEQQWENQKKEVKTKKNYRSQGVNQHENKRKKIYYYTQRFKNVFIENYQQ